MDKIDKRHSLHPFTPMDDNWVDQEENLICLNPGTPGTSMCGKSHKTPSHWVDIGRAQRMGRIFYQTRSNAMILHDTLPPVCIERVVFRKITKS